MSLCVAGSSSPSYLLSLYRISTSPSPSILLRSIAQPERFLRRGIQTASQCCVYSERWRDKDWVACGLNSSSLGNQFYKRGFTCEVGKTMTSGKETIYDIAVTDAIGKDVPLSNYRGKVLLIVNVASQCGLTTSNYTELTELYQKYKDEGLEILAFPCNQFGAQEPGSIKEIQNYVCTRFKAEYPIFSKVDVNGPTEAPLFKFLKSSKGGLFGDSIKWNFTKFLISKDGKVVERYGPTTPPSSIETDIKRQLAYAC